MNNTMLGIVFFKEYLVIIQGNVLTDIIVGQTNRNNCNPYCRFIIVLGQPLCVLFDEVLEFDDDDALPRCKQCKEIFIQKEI